MRICLAAAIVASLLGCESRERKPGKTVAPPVELGDLSTSLDAVRVAFNAHKGEARFLTLLSPT